MQISQNPWFGKSLIFSFLADFQNPLHVPSRMQDETCRFPKIPGLAKPRILDPIMVACPSSQSKWNMQIWWRRPCLHVPSRMRDGTCKYSENHGLGIWQPISIRTYVRKSKPRFSEYLHVPSRMRDGTCKHGRRHHICMSHFDCEEGHATMMGARILGLAKPGIWGNLHVPSCMRDGTCNGF